MKYILSIDQGTTGSRAYIFDKPGRIVSSAYKEFRQIYPREGWVEHDPEEIWRSVECVVKQALASKRIKPADIAAIGITNQRETTVLWDRKTGKPVYNAIVWQCRRTAGICEKLKKQGNAGLFRRKTGLVIDAYFSATKIKWILDNVKEKENLCFGTIDTWLIWKLTGGRVHATDYTNASRTMVFNIKEKKWDGELLRILGIPKAILPEVRPSSSVFGATVKGACGLPAGIPIAGVAGDQQAALFGQNCFESGQAKNTYGTGCFMLMNVGPRPVASRHRLVSTVAWQAGGRTDFALEGSVFIGGAVVQWLRDGLGLIKSSAEIERLAATVPDCGDVYLVPAFAGLGAPHWDQYARGTITGLTRGTTAGHLARAALDGIAFQVADILDVMRQDSGVPIHELRADGGACANDLLMQFQSDILRARVARPKVIETTALGAAYLAGLAVGFWKDRAEVGRAWQIDRVFEPRRRADEAAHRRGRWTEALRRALDWEEHATMKPAGSA